MWMKGKNAILFFLLVFCLELFLSGCSEESKPPKETKPTENKVSLQLQWVTQAQFAGYYVALDKGWYKDEGIELTINPGGPDIIPIDLLASGSRDFGTAMLSDLAVAIQKGQPVVSIAQIQQANGLLLIAKKSSGIEEPRDFIGKRIGIWFQGFEAQFNALLAKEDIPNQDVKIVSQGWSMRPFLKGDLDVASAMIYNEYHVVLESGLSPDNLNIIDYRSYGLDFPGDTLFTSRKMVEQNSDLCRRMLRVSLKGWQYAVGHPEEAVDIVLKFDDSGTQKRTHQLVMMREIAKLVQKQGHTLGKTDHDAVVKMLEVLRQFGILEKEIRAEDIYNADLLTKSAS